MEKKEKLRFVISCILSVLFIIYSVFIIGAAYDAIFRQAPLSTENIFGTALFGMMKLTVLIFGIGVLSMGGLAAFFAFSFRNHSKKNMKAPMKSIFISNICFIVLDALSLFILLL